MGKLKVPNNVDLASATIGGCLKQIRRLNVALPEDHVPSTMPVYVCEILPQQTKSIVNFIENTIKPLDASDFTHIKRFRKNAADATSKVTISAVLCRADLFAAKEDLVALLAQSFDSGFSEELLSIIRIPDELPPTKEFAVKWSNEIWPLSWKGNPNHQDLITASFDLDEEARIIDELVRNNENTDGTLTPDQLPVCTIVAEQDLATKKIRVLHVVRDTRHEHVLQHSVMNAIAAEANTELERRKQKEHHLERNGDVKSEGDTLESEGYLCHNLLVYTTHEPCTMCAMALVHLRIGRLVYLKAHPLGAVESSHYIGDRRDLNWTFDIWRWVGPVRKEVLDLPQDVAP